MIINDVDEFDDFVDFVEIIEIIESIETIEIINSHKISVLLLILFIELHYVTYKKQEIKEKITISKYVQLNQFFCNI